MIVGEGCSWQEGDRKEAEVMSEDVVVDHNAGDRIRLCSHIDPGAAAVDAIALNQHVADRTEIGADEDRRVVIEAVARGHLKIVGDNLNIRSFA